MISYFTIQGNFQKFIKIKKMKTNYNFDKSAYYGSKHEQFLLFRKNKLLMTEQIKNFVLLVLYII